jgi:hypothetical protein
MKRFSVPAVLLLVLTASTAFAGELFGTISEANKPVPAGVKVEVATDGKSYSTETDAFGAFRVFVKEKGKCTLKVYYKEQSPTFTVVSFDKSTRYDLVLDLNDGKYTLKRK